MILPEKPLSYIIKRFIEIWDGASLAYLDEYTLLGKAYEERTGVPMTVGDGEKLRYIYNL